MNVWFNQWFSTAYHLIQLIKKGSPNKFEFIGSSRNANAIYKKQCKKWFIEPDNITELEYVNFCLNFCKENKINIFIPRRGLNEIAQCQKKFFDIGVRILCDKNYKIISMLENKKETYEFFVKRKKEYIPQYSVINKYEEFLYYYHEMLKYSSRVCYKFIKDEGAVTFRVIDNSIINDNGILNKPGAKITLEMAKSILKTYNFNVPIMIMPYLFGREISVDCLKTKQGNIIIPRYKIGHRYSEIRYDREIMKICQDIMNELNIKTPFNIQFKMDNDRVYLLEINPRMSGGLQLSCLASKINIPDLAINQLLGIQKDWHYPMNLNSLRVANIETPILI